MSSRFSSNVNTLLLVPAFVCGLGVVAWAAPAPDAAVQVYADPAQPSQERYNSPLSAGTLTLEDVLEAHKPPANPPSLPAPAAGGGGATATAPVLTPPVQSSATGLMLSQGMKAVLQKVGGAAVPPVTVRPPVGPAAQAQPIPLTAPAPQTVGGVSYEPGQAPHNLATGAIAAPAVATTMPAASSSVPSTAAAATEVPATDQSCDQKPEKWEKTCAEAGYPTNFVGKIVGETRTGCADGALHDVWVTNNCAPPDAQSPKADGACGIASNNEFDEAPRENLCAQGGASAVSGSGPWSWACSGVNGGDAAACIAPKRVTPVNGSCGAANGVAVTSAPSDDLCRKGNATSVSGSGPWTWSCKGLGKGNSESCIAPLVGGQHEAAESVPAATPVHAAATHTAPTPAPVADSGDKGDLCGSAAEILAYEAPDKDLCRVGSASAVNGDGPWSWSCTTNEGVTASCRTLSLSGDASEPAAPKAAPQAAVSSDAAPSATSPRLQSSASSQNPFVHPSAAPAPAALPLACGVAAATPSPQMPVTGLCQNGKASTVHGSGPWNWTCAKGHAKVACETVKSLDASCGPANGTALQSAPFAGLCGAGTPSGIQGDGPWAWTCNGSGGGASVSCAASVQGAAAVSENAGKVDGVCGASDGANVNQAPADKLCAAGAPSAVSGSGPWTWSCSGVNGGTVGSCSATKIVPPKPPGLKVNGLCGAANGVTSSAKPGEDLCVSGDSSSVVGNGPWNWSCIGQNGGMTVSCTAPLEPPAPIDGACGSASGVATLVKPQGGLCAAGITGAVNGKGPWTWTCSGANGGNPASCVAPNAGKGAGVPSTMTSSSDDFAGDPLAPPPIPSGLVTPQLPSSNNIPSLDKKTIPSLISSRPVPSRPPSAPLLAGSDVAAEVPSLDAGSQPLQPPSLRDTLPSAPVLQESAASRAASLPGNHLTLDPTISTILFARGSGNIDDTVVSTLDKLTNVLQANGDVRISLIAYADNTGSTPRDARRLSLSRALAVRGYLSSKGISESRIDVHAEGANTTSGYIDRVDVKVND